MTLHYKVLTDMQYKKNFTQPWSLRSIIYKNEEEEDSIEVRPMLTTFLSNIIDLKF